MDYPTNVTLREKAYAIIQKKLLSGEIRAGDLVSELALAEDIGMSRTPVREAIGKLEWEGLFDKVPRVGTLVRLPAQRELSELYGVREALESHAASVAANSLSANKLAMMENWHRELLTLIEEMKAHHLEALDETLLQRFFEADISFHSTVLGAVDNRRSMKIVNEFRVVQRIFEYGRMAYTVAVVESAAREHGQILQALMRGDAEAARFAMAAHIRSSREHAMQRFVFSGGSGTEKVPLIAPLQRKQRARRRLQENEENP